MFDKMLYADLQSTVHKRANAYIKNYNECQGQDNLGFQVREVTARTFEKLIAKYNREFWRKVKSPFFADDDRMPTIDISCSEITNLVGGGLRSVGGRVAKLCYLDLIRVHSISMKGYKISINPYFMFGSDVENVPKIEKLNLEKGFKFQVFLTPHKQSLPTLYGFKVKVIDKIYKAENVQLSNKNEVRGSKENEVRNLIPVELGGLMVHTRSEGLSNLQESKNIKLGGGEATGEPQTANLETIDFKEIANQNLSMAGEEGRVAKLREKALKKNKEFLYKPNIRRITDSEKVKFVEEFYDYMLKTIYPQETYNKRIETESKYLIKTQVFNSFGGENNYLEWFCQAQVYRGIIDQHARYHKSQNFVPSFPTWWLRQKDGNGNYIKGNFHCTILNLKKSRNVLIDEQKEIKLQLAIDAMVLEKYPRKMKEKTLKNLYELKFNQLSKSTGKTYIARFEDFVVQYYQYLGVI